MFKLPHPGSLSVDPASGALSYTAEDIRIPCRGKVEIEVVRYYNTSMEQPWNRLFSGGCFSFDERLRFEYVGDALTVTTKPWWTEVMVVPDEVVGDDKAPGQLLAVTVLYPGGDQHRFVRNSDGSFTAANPSVKRILRYNEADSTYTLGINGFGFHLFRDDGKLIAVEDAFGNRVRYDWEFVGDTATIILGPQLAAITDPIGRSLMLSYRLFPGAGDGITHELYFTRTIRDWTGRTWTYDTDNSGFIQAYTDPEGHVTRYYRGGDPLVFPYFAPPKGLQIPNLADVEPPILDRGPLGIHKIEFPNGEFVVNYPSGARPVTRRIGAQIFGGRLAVNHIYDVLGRRTTKLVGTKPPSAPFRTTALVPGSPIRRDEPAQTHFFEFNSDYNLVRSVDTLGNEYVNQFDDRYRMVASVNPKLGITRFEYDDAGNLVRETDPSGRSRRWEYHPTLPEVTRVVGPGDEAPAHSFEFHPLSGVVLRETDPLGNETRYEYSIHGELTAMTRKRGDRWTYRYSRTGNLLEMADGLGHVTRYEYDDLNRMVTHISPGRRVTRYTYNKLDLVTSVTGPDGETWSFEYDGNRNRTRVTNPLGHSVRYEFDNLNLLKKMVDPLGSVTSFSYDEFGNLIQTVDALGRKSSFSYDPLQRLLKATDPAGSATTFEHAKFCGETKVVDPLGRATVSHRDMLCRVTEVELPDGARVMTSYDDEGNVASVTDPLGNTTRFQYDKLGRPVQVLDALNGSETRTYDAHGNLTSATDRRGNTSRFEYDAADRLKKLTRRDGTSVSFNYDRDGLLESVTDARASTWRFQYDKAGRMSAALSPRGEQTVRNVYDSAGRLLERLSAMGRKVAFEYDHADRVVAVTDPLGHRSTRTYDQVGNLQTLVDPRGRAVNLEYDRLDRLVAVTDPLGGVVRRVLDAVGNLVSVLDQNGNRTSYEFDVMGRVTAEVYADATRLEWQYDLVGNLILQKDPRGFQTSYEYDQLHRLSRIRYDDEPEATFLYDAAGNLVRRTDGTGTYLFEHDKEDRVTAFVQGTGSRYQVQHDAEGSQTVLVFPDGSRQRTEYDADGRVAALITPDGGRTLFSYDADGRRTRLDRPNGTYTLYEYDGGSRLSRLAHLRTNGTQVTPDFRLTHDEVGNVLGITDEGTPLWTYGYDSLDRLIEAVDHDNSNTWQWSYDAVGNRLAETLNGSTTRSRYNNLNQLLQMGDTEFWYDQAGNLAQKTGSAGAHSYRFDSRNRLVEVNTADRQQVSYTYDKVGRMLTRKLKADAGPTKFEWDGWDLVREVDPNGLETFYYPLHGEYLTLRRANIVLSLHADALGSIRTVTDSIGNQIATISHDSWGEASEQPVDLGGTLQPEYVGQFGVFVDNDTNLHFMRNRWYIPSVGRFASRDPKANGMSLYEYALNSPVRFRDPSGLAVSIVDDSSTGGNANSTLFLQRLGEASGYNLEVKSGELRILDRNDVNWTGTSGPLRQLLRQMIDNPIKTKIRLVNPDPVVSFGSWAGSDLSGEQKIDMSDIEAAHAACPEVGLLFLNHELSEAYAFSKSPPLLQKALFWMSKYSNTNNPGYDPHHLSGWMSEVRTAQNWGFPTRSPFAVAWNPLKDKATGVSYGVRLDFGGKIVGIVFREKDPAGFWVNRDTVKVYVR